MAVDHNAWTRHSREKQRSILARLLQKGPSVCLGQSASAKRSLPGAHVPGAHGSDRSRGGAVQAVAGPGRGGPGANRPAAGAPGGLVRLSAAGGPAGDARGGWDRGAMTAMSLLRV